MNYLSLLYIETEILRKLNFSSITEKFSQRKSRKSTLRSSKKVSEYIIEFVFISGSSNCCCARLPFSFLRFLLRGGPNPPLPSSDRHTCISQTRPKYMQRTMTVWFPVIWFEPEMDPRRNNIDLFVRNACLNYYGSQRYQDQLNPPSYQYDSHVAVLLSVSIATNRKSTTHRRSSDCWKCSKR